MSNKYKISLIGLGYVGLPLALSLSKYFKVVGFDIDSERVRKLKKGIDITGESSKKLIKNSKIFISNEKKHIKESNIFIITVPTPVDKNKKPDLRSIIRATKIVASHLKKDSTIVFESTVYPGCTDDILIPIIEKKTKFTLNKDFFVGYSPERIDPGKSKYKLSNQIKIISGSNLKATKLMKEIYSKVVKRKLFVAANIKTAEAAKVIENSQRDINIAFVNELSMLFHKLDINTKDVLAAANTKWNFINFIPGLVGGHCIGVDPYYLKYKALKTGFRPFMISSGRKVNDAIPKFIHDETLKILVKKKRNKILFLGITFKENCNDIRNSKAFELYNFFKKKNKIYVYDPIVDKQQIDKLYNIKIEKNFKKKYYDIIIIAVPHNKIKKFTINYLRSLGNKNLKIIDIKSIFPKNKVDWQL
ncbi:nucleotide sugar dehydrogenase [Pelagibacterales bacterium SAG-MED28]|nr:nucleotide sugar dehydrogenase [Pelagibacterales bacterium SAG-MED28]|tara:strand:- start:8881 stop:10134 length:1254 start_codon:yes stop_codon:yes gene_type:complete